MHRNGYKGCFFKFTWLGAGGSSCYLHYFNLIHASRTYNVTSPLRWLGSVRCNKRSAYASGLNRRGDPGVCELVSTREWAKNSNSIYKNSSLSLSLCACSDNYSCMLFSSQRRSCCDCDCHRDRTNEHYFYIAKWASRLRHLTTRHPQRQQQQQQRRRSAAAAAAIEQDQWGKLEHLLKFAKEEVNEFRCKWPISW